VRQRDRRLLVGSVDPRLEQVRAHRKAPHPGGRRDVPREKLREQPSGRFGWRDSELRQSPCPLTQRNAVQPLKHEHAFRALRVDHFRDTNSSRRGSAFATVLVLRASSC
jgi:hypothetical protein